MERFEDNVWLKEEVKFRLKKLLQIKEAKYINLTSIKINELWKKIEQEFAEAQKTESTDS